MGSFAPPIPPIVVNPPAPAANVGPDPMGVSGAPTGGAPVITPPAAGTPAKKPRAAKADDTEAPKRKLFVKKIFDEERAGIPDPGTIPADASPEVKAAFEIAAKPMRDANLKAVKRLIAQDAVKIKAVDFKQEGVGLGQFYRLKVEYHAQKAAEWQSILDGKKSLTPEKAKAKLEKMKNDMQGILDALGGQGVDLKSLNMGGMADLVGLLEKLGKS